MASPNDTPQAPKAPDDDDTTPGTGPADTTAGDSPQDGAAGDAPRRDADGIEDAELAADSPADDSPPEGTAPDDTTAGDAPPKDAGTQDPWGARDAGDGHDPADTTGDQTAADASQEPETRDPDAAADDGRETEGAAALAAGAGAAAGLAAAASTPRDAGDGGRAAPPPDDPPRPSPQPRGSLFPLILGGALAAGLGAGALWWLESEGIVTLSGTDFAPLEARIAEQADRAGALEGTLDTLADRVAATEDALAAAPEAAALEALSDRTAALADSVAAVEERLESFDDLPLAADPEAREILQGFRSEVASLRSELAEARERSDAMIAAVEAEAERADAAEGALDAIASEAASAEAVARARGALRLVEAAFANGGPFDSALEVIEDAGVEVPVTLELMGPDGVPTPSDLLAEFPPLARDALQISLRDVEDKPFADRMTAFLRLQFGMRSLAPRDGDDTDAVLSRVEDAVRAGRHDEVLAELALLPPQVRAPLDPWAARIETRREAEAALADLSARIDSF